MNEGPNEPDPHFESLIARTRELAARPVPQPGERRPYEPEPAPVRTEHRVGLVLSGGAAKGAYQVGAVRRLAEEGVRLTAVAGTSIGALNAAVLAGSPDLATGCDRLDAAWAWFTHRFGEGPHGDASGEDESVAAQFGNLGPRIARLLANRGDLEELFDRAVDIPALRAGIPCRVAVFRVGVPVPIHFKRLRSAQLAWQMTRAKLGARSDLITLNDESEDEVRDVVLGSAALPVIFPPRAAGGVFYRDGMLGGDNTPIRALVDVDHCDVVIVVHLSPGETVRYKEHPGLTLFQIRPSRPLVPPGPLGAVGGPLDFSPSRFRALYERGYRDAEALATKLRVLTGRVTEVRHTERLMADRVQRVVDGRSLE